MKWQLLAGLPADRAEEVLASARRRIFRRGDILFHQGDHGQTTHLVDSGHFGLRVTSAQGQDCTLRIFGPGEIFGRIALPPVQAVRAATMVAIEGGETYELGRELMDDLRTRYPSVNDTLIGLAGEALYWVSQRYLEVLFLDADTRVRLRLLELGRQYRDGEGDGPVVIAVTQEDLAGLAGTSRATVNRVLGDEQRRGTLTRRRGKLLLFDPDAIEQRAQPIEQRTQPTRPSRPSPLLAAGGGHHGRVRPG